MICLNRGSITHVLKIRPEPFKEVRAGRKTAELRIDDGRDFRIGDTMRLQEWLIKKKQFTGRAVSVRITHITWVSHWITQCNVPWAMLSFAKGKTE